MTLNSSAGNPLPVGLRDVQDAAGRLKGVINTTPLQVSRTLGEQCGATVYLKPESLQRTGSFKIRGAYNKVASLTPEERARGVITYSSGNHAQGVACAAALMDTRAVVVMPEDAVRSKVEATKGYGAEVLFAGLTSLDRQARALELQKERGYTVAPPFDDPAIIAGQGTVALEILEELPDVDCILVPCGGGGLLAGIALAARSMRPEVQVYGVEPEGAADARDSMAAGRLVDVNPKTLCDGLRTTRIGELNFRVIQEFVTGIVTVPDETALDAMQFLALRARLVVEPSGSVAVAALLTGALPVAGKRVVAVLSGGNVEPDRLVDVLSR